MSTGYSGDKYISRQRVCSKCFGFVTHDKAADDQFACALCGHKIGSSPQLGRKVPASIIAEIVANQHREAEEERQRAIKAKDEAKSET